MRSDRLSHRRYPIQSNLLEIVLAWLESPLPFRCLGAAAFFPAAARPPFPGLTMALCWRGKERNLFMTAVNNLSIKQVNDLKPTRACWEFFIAREDNIGAFEPPPRAGCTWPPAFQPPELHTPPQRRCPGQPARCRRSLQGWGELLGPLGAK